MNGSAIVIVPAARRFATRFSWLRSHHCFSFGQHYDPTNVGHGLLIVSNDDVVAPGGGFGTHAHRDMEIVTWVLEGELEHRDSIGTHGVIRPGLVQRMSAGRGIQHSEMNASRTAEVHFLQMWVVPDRFGIEPGYEQIDVGPALRTGALVPVASGRGHEGAVHLHQAGAVMWAARLPAGATTTLPDAPFVHLYVAAGAAAFGDHRLEVGDAVRLWSAGNPTVTAEGDCEIVVWETDAEAR